MVRGGGGDTVSPPFQEIECPCRSKTRDRGRNPAGCHPPPCSSPLSLENNATPLIPPPPHPPPPLPPPVSPLSFSKKRCHPDNAAPRAPPASPAAGWIQMFSKGPSRRMRPFATQLRATPPARQRFFCFR